MNERFSLPQQAYLWPIAAILAPILAILGLSPNLRPKANPPAAAAAELPHDDVSSTFLPAHANIVSHESRKWSDPFEFLDELKPSSFVDRGSKAIDVVLDLQHAQQASLLFMCVMVPGNAKNQESRIRERHAVELALSGEGFSEAFPSRMSYALVKDIRLATSAASYQLATTFLPIKLYHQPAAEIGTQPRLCIVMWMNENLLPYHPLTNLRNIIEAFIRQHSDDPAKNLAAMQRQAAMVIVGPSNSDVLGQIVHEHEWHVRRERAAAVLDGSRPPPDRHHVFLADLALAMFGSGDRGQSPQLVSQLSDLPSEYDPQATQTFWNRWQGARLLSPHATSTFEFSAVDYVAPSGDGGVRHTTFEGSRPLVLCTRNGDRLRVSHMIGTDHMLAEKLSRELTTRLRFNPALVSSPRRVLLVYEEDTWYGRSLFRQFSEQLASRDSRFDVKAFPILRDVSRQTAELDERPTATDESADTDSVIDYFRRASHLQFGAQQGANAGYQAIGVFTTRQQDKLLLLRELRGLFPYALFFTVDRDASYERTDWYHPYRNLIVASHFGLSGMGIERFLNRGSRHAHTDNDRNIVYRNVYQLATYAAVRLAAHDFEGGHLNDDHYVLTDRSTSFDLYNLWGETGAVMARDSEGNEVETLQPQLWEVGVGTSYLLDSEAELPATRAWYADTHVSSWTERLFVLTLIPLFFVAGFIGRTFPVFGPFTSLSKWVHWHVTGRLWRLVQSSPQEAPDNKGNGTVSLTTFVWAVGGLAGLWLALVVFPEARYLPGLLSGVSIAPSTVLLYFVGVASLYLLMPDHSCGLGYWQRIVHKLNQTCEPLQKNKRITVRQTVKDFGVEHDCQTYKATILGRVCVVLYSLLALWPVCAIANSGVNLAVLVTAVLLLWVAVPALQYAWSTEAASCVISIRAWDIACLLLVASLWTMWYTGALPIPPARYVALRAIVFVLLAAATWALLVSVSFVAGISCMLRSYTMRLATALETAHDQLSEASGQNRTHRSAKWNKTEALQFAQNLHASLVQIGKVSYQSALAFRYPAILVVISALARSPIWDAWGMSVPGFAILALPMAIAIGAALWLRVTCARLKREAIDLLMDPAMFHGVPRPAAKEISSEWAAHIGAVRRGAFGSIFEDPTIGSVMLVLLATVTGPFAEILRIVGPWVGL